MRVLYKRLLPLLPFVLVLALWMGTNIAATEKLREAEGTEPVAATVVNVLPEVADVAQSLGVSEEEAKTLIERGRDHADGLSEIREIDPSREEPPDPLS